MWSIKPYQSTLWQGLVCFNAPSSVIDASSDRLTLSPRALALLLVLCQKCKKPNREDNDYFSCLIEQRELEIQSGLSRPSVIKATEELKACKYIATDKRYKRGVTKYSMVDPDGAEVLAASKRGKSLYFANDIRHMTLPTVLVTRPEQYWSIANMRGSEVAMYVSVISDANRTHWKLRTHAPLSLSDAISRSALDKRTALTAVSELDDKGLLYLRTESIELCDLRTGMPFFDASELPTHDVNNYAYENGRKLFINSPWTLEETERLIEACIQGAEVKRAGKELRTVCPFHPDSNPSCYFNPQKRVYFCHSCKATGTFYQFAQRITNADVVPFLAEIRGASYREPTNTNGTEDVYVYRDRNGQPVKQRLRYPDKQRFGWQRWERNRWEWNLAGDTPKLLYNLPEVLKASTVAIAEGEKDCATIANVGLQDVSNLSRVVPTTMGSADDWGDEFADDLIGKRVIVFPDSDEPGRRCRNEIIASLHKRRIEHTVIDFQPYGVNDVSDFLKAHTSDELVSLIGGGWVSQSEITPVITEF